MFAAGCERIADHPRCRQECADGDDCKCQPQQRQLRAHPEHAALCRPRQGCAPPAWHPAWQHSERSMDVEWRLASGPQQACLWCLAIPTLAEIRKPGSAPGNLGGAAAPPQPANGIAAEGLQAREQLPPRQAAPQPAPVPAGQQSAAPGVFEVPQAFAPRAAAAAAPAAKPASRLPSRRDKTGIPAGPGAPAAAASAPAAPPPVFAYQQPVVQPVYQAEQRQAAAPPPVQQPAPVQQQFWDTPPAGTRLAAPASCGDDLLGQVIAAEDDLITAHRCGGLLRECEMLLPASACLPP